MNYLIDVYQTTRENGRVSVERIATYQAGVDEVCHVDVDLIHR